MTAVSTTIATQCLPEPVVIFRQTQLGQKFICIGSGCLKSPDQVALHLYNTVKRVQQFFLQAFNLCGVDGKGKMLPFTVGWDENNAVWSCEAEKCYWKFNDSLATIPEVAAHEMTHAVVQYSRVTPLVLSGQTGALNESIANVLAIAFRHWSGKPDWNIGDLYDLSAHTDVSQFKVGTEDAGFIHDNSAIPSHAFFHAVQCSKTTSYGNIGSIWLTAMSKVSANASFGEFACTTVDLTSQKNPLRGAIINAWLHVGVFKLQVSQPPATPVPAPQKSFLKKLFG